MKKSQMPDLSTENAYIEFKSSFNDGVIETLSAFANTKGGSVHIGVDDKGNPVKGFVIGKETLQKWANEVKLKTQPSIIPDVSTVLLKGIETGLLSVKAFPVKPVAFKGRFYRRVGNANHQLSTSEISVLYIESLQLSWDSYPYAGATYKNINEKKVIQFIKKVNAGGRFILPENPQKALTLLKLIKGSKPSNAAMILFSKENLFFNVHVGRFRTPSLIIDEKMINGNLFDVVREVMKFIDSHLKVAFEITGMTTQRREIFEYPSAAIRELVLNALIHRDYTSPSDVQIKIFDQKISFYNPGKLYGGISIQELNEDDYTSQLRNKLIAEAFYLTKEIEKYGTGFSRIRGAIETYPTMQFVYKEQGYGFVTVLEYSKQKISDSDRRLGEKLGERLGERLGKEVGEKVGEILTTNQQQIVKAMAANKQVTFKELSRMLQISEVSIHNNVSTLRKMDIIKRIGSARGGYWEVNND